MKSNGLASLLTGAVMISALVAAWVSAQYFFAMRQLQKAQVDYANMNNAAVTAQTAAQSLANEAFEYSKTHPTIDPVLFQFGIKARPTNAAAPANSPALQK